MNKKLRASLVMIAILILMLYGLVTALPMLIGLTANVTYLLGLLLVVIFGVFGLVKLFKYLSKSDNS